MPKVNPHDADRPSPSNASLPNGNTPSNKPKRSKGDRLSVGEIQLGQKLRELQLTLRPLTVTGAEEPNPETGLRPLVLSDYQMYHTIVKTTGTGAQQHTERTFQPVSVNSDGAIIVPFGLNQRLPVLGISPALRQKLRRQPAEQRAQLIGDEFDSLPPEAQEAFLKAKIAQLRNNKS